MIVLSTELPANTGVSLPNLYLYTTPIWYVLKDLTDLLGIGSESGIAPSARSPKVLTKLTFISGVICSPPITSITS